LEEEKMARTVEESVMNAIIGAFAGQGQTTEAKPSKSYMAIGTSVPKVGEHYKCKRLEKKSNNGELIFCSTETTTVQKVTNLAGNVFIVVTRNSYYITRVLYMPVENVHFAIVKNKPQICSHLHCYKLEFSGENSRCVNWETTTVQEVKLIKGLYKVKTRNSVYVCFPMN